MLWAVIAFALAACIGEVYAPQLGAEARDRYGLRPGAGAGALFADALLDNARDAGPLAVVVVLVGASVVTGGVMGRIAARLRGSRLRRIVMLSLVAVPALWIIVAATWAVGWAPRVIAEEPAKMLWMPLGALWFATIGIVVGAPLLALPVVFAAVLLEGWTRPEALPQTGLARPGLRRAVLLTLAAVAAALTTFAALNWRR